MRFSAIKQALQSRSSSFTDSDIESSSFFQFVPLFTSARTSYIGVQYALLDGEIQEKRES
jgi:hypothetical protein